MCLAAMHVNFPAVHEGNTEQGYAAGQEADTFTTSDSLCRYFAMVVGIPAAMLWCLGVPSLFCYVLHRERNRLHTESVIASLGFLYSGYHPKLCFWEISIMMRKLAIVATTSLVSNTQQSFIRLFLCLGIIWVSLLLQVRRCIAGACQSSVVKPHVQKEEFICMVSLMWKWQGLHVQLLNSVDWYTRTCADSSPAIHAPHDEQNGGCLTACHVCNHLSGSVLHRAFCNQQRLSHARSHGHDSW
jgi:hypothetical protein